MPAAGDRLWLKGFGCVRRDGNRLTYVGDDIAAVREEGVPVVHWVPAGTARRVRLRTVEGDVTGWAEPGFVYAPVDEVVQFERVGFARVDAHADASFGVDDEDVGPAERSVAYFAHE